MFEKILIANRGEIACRVVDTARLLGVKTVAVYSDADAGARHVAMADQAFHIGGSPPAKSYLRGDVIITAALESGAQAIHPGYGFLSENPDFVDAVEAAGLVFIGPSANAIRAMGLKDAAKTLMEKAGVPVVPGYHGADQNDDFLQGQAGEIGFPVMIKAVAGGGGKGMRLVESGAEFLTALKSARAESQAAFGNDAVLIEKFINTPRHIEVQIFGDGQNVVHLFERDCSLQRRHQKVIEEAPAPGMSNEMRTALGDAAVRAARAISYKGAGTIEFIVDGSQGLRPDRFWFMEMNTRLQVEHPVTEAITGVDLVEWQLRVAAGEALPKTQSELTISGHAFEARLYAEDVPGGFLPATGTLDHLRFPTHARADTGVRSGDVISSYYDPMIAKIIVSGPTREIALLRLNTALAATEVAGTITNLTFLGKLSRNSEFRAGQVDTGLIERNLDALTLPDTPANSVIAWALIVAADLHEMAGQTAGFSLWKPASITRQVLFDGVQFAGEITVHRHDHIAVAVNDDIIVFRKLDGVWSHADSGQTYRHFANAHSVSVFGEQTWQFDIADPLAVETKGGDAGNIIAAPMPGLVKQVHVCVGDMVQDGDGLVVLEAMKMEHVLCAPRDGRIAEVMAAQNDQVEAGASLITLEEADT